MIDKYTFRLEWSEEDCAYIARCLEFPSLAAHGSTREEALQQIEAVVLESVQWMEEEGDEIPEPMSAVEYRGNILFRATPVVHRELAYRAAETGVSVNQLLYGFVQRQLAAETLSRSIDELSTTIGVLRRKITELEWCVRSGSSTVGSAFSMPVDTNDQPNVPSYTAVTINTWPSNVVA